MFTPRKILILRFSSIGDILLATPLLRVLRSNFPSSRIDFVVRKEYAELIRNNKNLDNIIEFDARNGFFGLRQLKATLRMERYDLIIDIHNSLRSRYLRWMMQAAKVVIISKRLIARTMLVRFKKNFYRNTVSVADRYIETVQQYGLKNDGQGLELTIPDGIRNATINKFNKIGIRQSGTLIGICPAAKHATKCWPQERYAELGVKLSEEANTQILLIGGAEDKEKCKAIAYAINSVRGEGVAINLSGDLSLLESAGALDACHLIITNDTGLMHMACALKKKVVAIFGSTVGEFGFFPVGTDSVVVERQGLYCRPCSHIGLPACPEQHFRCMNEIQVDDVLKSIHTFTKQPTIQ